MEKIFDLISSEYDFMNNIISLYTHKIIKKIVIKYAKLTDDMLVLDLFTGTGDIAGEIKNKHPFITVVGADNSREMLRIAQKKYKNIYFLKENSSNLTFKTGVFDRVFSTFGLRNSEDKIKSIREIKRVLKKGGLFLHLDFNSKSKISKIYDKYVLLCAKFFAKNKEAYNYLINSKNSYYTLNELKEIFLKEGFEIELNKNFLFDVINLQIVRKK